ncbi:MAG: HAD family hydrolase [Akkermansiaceae bacterium]|nr:HAD family hydrolase [Akkermansiaceae bacterium]
MRDESQTAVTEARRCEQRAFECAAQAIAGRDSAGAGDPASFGIEIGNLESWARETGALIPCDEVDRLPLVSNHTSEHEVFYRQHDDRAIKRTWPGVYGQIPIPLNGVLDRRNATPSEYLMRMALHIEVFASDIRLEGVSISDKPSMIIGQPAGQPSVVISQLWYEKSGTATNEIIHDFLVGEGFRPVPSSYFGWFRPEDRVVIVDAKPDNFIQTPKSLIPIDLQMAQFSPEQFELAGLRSDATSPVIFIPR